MGYDANAFFFICMHLPTQIALIRREEDGFKKEFPGISEGCRDYLDWTAHDRNIKIQSALHGGGEKKIHIKSMDFVKKIILSLNSMVIIGMHTLIFS